MVFVKLVIMGFFWLNVGGWKYWIDENRICYEKYIYGVVFFWVNNLVIGNVFRYLVFVIIFVNLSLLVLIF